MADDATPKASLAPAVEEIDATLTDTPEVKEPSDVNGKETADTAPEPGKEVATEDTAPVEASDEKATIDLEIATKDVTDDMPTAPTNKSEDVEMIDDKEGNKEEGVETADGPAATPASTGKSAARRKSGGIPEHKAKKVNKKKSMAKMQHLDAKPGDQFFLRLKGFPQWPGIVCDEEMLPAVLTKVRPVTAARPDGTYREGYGDGQPKAKDRTFPCMFFQTNEFAWVPNYDLLDMDDEQLASTGPKIRADLRAAYQLAQEKNPLEYYKDLLEEHEAQKAADLADLAAKDLAAKDAQKAAAAAKKTKKPRVSSAKMDHGGDMEMADADAIAEPESEDADTPAVKSKTKKRKAEDESETPQRAESVKKPRPTIKLNNSNSKVALNGTPTSKPAKEPSTAKSAKPKTKKAAKEKDAPAETPKKPELSAEEKSANKQKEILFLRHKLQKGLLTKDQFPKESEMKQMSEFVTKLEGYSDLEVSIIRQTKINKVLKAILKLNSIPLEEEYHFKTRSQSLLDKWNKLLASETGTPVASAATNGAATDKKNGAERSSKAEPSVPTNGTKEAKAEEEPEVSPAAVEAKKDDKERSAESAVEEPAKEIAPEPAAVESSA